MDYTVVCLEIFPQKVKAVIQAAAPENYQLLFAESYDNQYRIDLMRKADYVIVSGPHVTPEMLYAAKNLKLIQRWGVGYDTVPLVTAKELNIPVAITAGGNTIPVAEFTLAMMLSICRRIPYIDNAMRNGQWVRAEMRDCSYMLYHKTIGIIGMGNIARRVASLLAPFEARLVYFDMTRLDNEVENQLGVTYTDFNELISISDLITIHIPLTKQSKYLIAKKEFDSMKKGVILVNIARGGIVCESDLIEALKNGQVSGAAIDVYEKEPPDINSELFKLPNTVVTSHNGGGTFDNVANMAAHCFSNMKLIEEGKVLPIKDRIV